MRQREAEFLFVNSLRRDITEREQTRGECASGEQKERERARRKARTVNCTVSQNDLHLGLDSSLRRAHPP